MDISKKLYPFFNFCLFLRQIKLQLDFCSISAEFQLDFSLDSRGAQLGSAQLEKFPARLGSPKSSSNASLFFTIYELS